MGFNDHYGDLPLEYEIEKCPKCGENFHCIETEQVIGCKSEEEKVCPYCGEILKTSMEYEYTCSKLSEEEIKYLKSKGIKL